MCVGHRVAAARAPSGKVSGFFCVDGEVVFAAGKSQTFSPPTSVTLGNLGARAAKAILGAFRRRAEERPVLGASLGNLGAAATLAILGSLGARSKWVPAFPVSQLEGGMSDARPSSGTSS